MSRSCGVQGVHFTTASLHQYLQCLELVLIVTLRHSPFLLVKGIHHSDQTLGCCAHLREVL